jgi:hypothetical protein
MSDPAPSAAKKEPVLKGWLVWIFLSLLAGIGLNAFIIYALIFGFDQSESILVAWRNGLLSDADGPTLLAIGLDFVLPMLSLLYLTFLMRLFFKRSRKFPYAFFMFAGLSICMLLLQGLAYTWAGFSLDGLAPGGGGVIGTLAGYQYLITQKRPKTTFVH